MNKDKTTYEKKRSRRLARTVLSQAEIGAIMDQIPSHTMTGIRDRLGIGLLYRHGLRVSELINLDRMHVDMDNDTISLVNAKCGSDRVLGIDPTIRVWLETYLKVWGIKYGPLLKTWKDTRMSTGHFRTVLIRAGHRAGITKRLYPHCLRHSFAAELAKENVPINLIQRMLGHSSLATTSIYLDHVSPVSIIRTMNERTGWMRDINYGGR